MYKCRSSLSLSLKKDGRVKALVSKYFEKEGRCREFFSFQRQHRSLGLMSPGYEG